MTRCSTVDVETRCNSVEITDRNKNLIEVVTQRPRGSVTVTKTITNTAIIDDRNVSNRVDVVQSYVHMQSSPSATWIVNHNLSYNPAVSIISSTGDLVHGDVNYSGLQQITINFSAPFSGRVYLS